MTGNRLLEWRLRTRHSQREVATLLGLTTTSVTRHENGNRGLTHEVVLRYARLYKVPTYALFLEPGVNDGMTFPSEYNIFPNRIRYWREMSRLTEGEVSWLTGIEPKELEHIEEGRWKPDHAQIMKLAGVFKVASYQLFTKLSGRDPRAHTPVDEPTEDVSKEPAMVGDAGTPYEQYIGGPYGQIAADVAL